MNSLRHHKFFLWFLAVVVGTAVLTVDQFTKSWAQSAGRVTWNANLALGWGGVPSVFLLVIFAGVVIGLGWRIWRQTPWLLGVFLGGVSGNLIDRVVFGSVRDWLPLFGGIRNNFADWAVVLALLAVLWQEWRQEAI